MTVWTLADHGAHGALHLGQSWTSVTRVFGEPTDAATNNKPASSIYKYDDIELIFLDGRLWCVHCEIGPPPLPNAVRSDCLGLESDGLTWPVDRDELVGAAKGAGVSLRSIDDPLTADAEVLVAGMARIQLERDGQLIWSVREA